MKIIKHYGYMYDIVKRLLNEPDAISLDCLGSRWSGKTKSVLITLGMLLMINNSEKYKNKIVRINWIRVNVNSVNENFNEFLDTVNELGIYTKLYINRKDRFIKYKNVEIRFIGYESSKNRDVKKLGIKRSANVDFLINVFEEVFEFDTYKDVNRVEQAIGGAKSSLTISLSNPWNETHWWLSRINRDIKSIGQKFEIDIMNSSGSQFFKINNNRYIDWTNHRINHYLSDIEHEKLIETWQFDPEQAKIVDLGQMGVVEGGIYTRSITNVSKNIPNNYKPFYYFVGVDVGTTRDATAFYLMSHNKDKTEFAVHQEYYHSHSDNIFLINGKEQGYRPKNILAYANDLINIVSKWSKILGQKLICEIDFTSNLYQIVNEFSLINHVGDLLEARPCQKVPISLRVDMTCMLMNKKALHIAQSMCPKLIEEFKGAKYPDKTNQKLANKGNHYDIIRLDGKDHGINAFEYGIGAKFLDIRDLPYNELYINKMWKFGN